MNFAGKVAVVLGASSGVGWATAEMLVARGAKVVVSARREERLRQLSGKIGVAWKRCDVADEHEVQLLSQFARETYGPIDIAVNCVGMPLGGTIAEQDSDVLRTEVAVNFLGNVWFIRHMASVMNDGGSIILFSSMAATHPMPPFFGYACSKAAADAMVKYAAMEYGPRGIRVNSILPGAIRTEMAAGIFSNPEMEKIFTKEVPLGRVAEAEDIADAVLWLAGPNAYITGCNLDISGGNQLTRFPRSDEYAAGVSAELGHSSGRHLDN